MPLILIAEDDTLTRELLAQTLQIAGFQVVTASNGREALNEIFMKTPDLVVLDMYMPGITGFEVIEQIKVQPELNHVKIVAVTGSAMIDHHEQLKLVDILLKKPVGLETLIRHVNSLLSAPI